MVGLTKEADVGERDPQKNLKKNKEMRQWEYLLRRAPQVESQAVYQFYRTRQKDHLLQEGSRLQRRR